MSSYKVISEVSKLLCRTLWNGFAGDIAITQSEHVPNENTIVLMNPADAAREENRRLSMWLYQISQNEFMRNLPVSRVPQRDDLVQYPPFSVNLTYLITPYTKSVEGDQIVLGRVMQIFHDRPILLLESAEQSGTAEEVHLNMCQRTIQELAEVWEALQQPYRLSVCYEVRVPRIESLRTERTGRVAERIAEFEDV